MTNNNQKYNNNNGLNPNFLSGFKGVGCFFIGLFTHPFILTVFIAMVIYAINNCLDVLVMVLDIDPFFTLLYVPPIKIYSNVEADKAKIIQENKNKAGIYIWTNKINGKRYVGSSDNLRNRMYSYLNIKSLENYNHMPINRALLKYGHSKFSLQIIEYCKKKDVRIREKYWMDLLVPEYNIIKDPTLPPMTDLTHSPETRKKMSDTAKKIEHTGRFKKGENHPNYGKPRTEGAGSPAQKIEVFDQDTNENILYNSIREAARALDINMSNITKYFSRNQQKPYKGRYTFRKL